MKRLPSEEKPWLKWYVENAREMSHNVETITLYQKLIGKFREQGDQFTALQYFGNNISRSEFISQTDRWARALYGMGIREDERVIIFIPFTPEAAYIILALNKIGAWPVMLNLGSSPEALTQGCANARFAIVSDSVENRIAHALRNNPAFEKVVLLTVATDMGFPYRQLVSLNKGRESKKMLKDARNYISSKEVLKRWENYEGNVEAPCKMERPAIITSSSGTSKAGYAKQIMDSNHAVISMMEQIEMTSLPERFPEGTMCYCGLPPFISTSFLVLFLLPLYHNMTCMMDPRMDPEVFYKNVMKCKPQLCLITGRCWVYFFTQIERLIKNGKTPDLSFFTLPIMGGDGIIVKDMKWMNGLLKKCGSKVGLCSGYGMSEMFSLLSVDSRPGFAADNDTQSVISVGAPMPGSDVCVIDENGNELTYGERGEVCARGETLMLGYYNDQKTTDTAVHDGWYHSGDLGSIDEDGNIYVYGRMSDCYKDEKGRQMQPFDIEILINQDKDVHYTMVNNMAPSGQRPRLAVHLVLDHNCPDRDAAIRRIDEAVSKILPDGLKIEGYKVHRHIFRMNLVLKLDRRYYKEQLTGYFRPEGDTMKEVTFE